MKNILTLALLIILAFSANSQEYETIIEDFDDNSRGWSIEDSDKGMAKIEDGFYKIQNKVFEKTRAFYCRFIIDPLYDYSIEMKLTQISGDDNYGIGLMWGFDSWSDYFRFQISNNGYTKINGKRGGEDVVIQDWVKEDDQVINGIGTSNTIIIEKTNSGIEYYVNGIKIYSGENLKYIGTDIGVCLGSQMEVEIDYIKVKREKTVLNLVDDPINGYKLENLGPKVNSKYSEKSPKISPDGKTLYITRDHPDNIGGENTDDIWYSEQDENGEWTEMKPIGFPINNAGNNSLISVTPDGNSMLVKGLYNNDGTTAGSGVSIAYKRDGNWQIPEKQEIIDLKNVNQYSFYYLTSDGTKLIMAIEDENSYGDMDLYISFLLDDGRWSKPKNMGSTLNTFSGEFGQFLASDGKTLYFTSYGHEGYGSADIFVSKRLDDTWLSWSEPKNLGPEINSKGWDAYFCVSAIGDYAYMISSKEDITLGNEDIFRIKIGESTKPDPVIIVKGKVFNQKTNEAIEAQILYENLNTGKSEGKAFSTIDNGYKIVLPAGSAYGFRANAENFVSVSENIDLKDLEAFAEKEVNLYLVPIEKGQKVRLNNIFFDFDKATLKAESYPELDRLVDIMNKNQDIKIEIAGHTDNKGSDDYNLNLSRSRAEAVMKYVTDKGIDQSRISSKGYGESNPIADNETEEGRQLNRRVEFEIL